MKSTADEEQVSGSNSIRDLCANCAHEWADHVPGIFSPEDEVSERLREAGLGIQARECNIEICLCAQFRSAGALH